MQLALVKQRTPMTHGGSNAMYFVYESGCREKREIWASEA